MSQVAWLPPDVSVVYTVPLKQNTSNTSGMERVITLRELRDTGRLPGDFAAQHPQVLLCGSAPARLRRCSRMPCVLHSTCNCALLIRLQVARLVSWLMAADAADRPTARQV